MKDTKKISFIIPVYNSGKYITKCVQSIQKSSKKVDMDIEIILVNDGSSDDSGATCEKMAREDNRITVLLQENAGICTARNNGLAIARGEWICLMDHDDVLDEEGLSTIAKVIDEDSQIIYFGFDEFFSEELIVHGKKIEEPRCFDMNDIKKMQWDCLCRYNDNKPILSYRLLTTPWGKIYRRSFLEQNSLKFVDSLRREEDVAFNLMCLSRCTNAKWFPFPLYHYRQFIGSESHSYKKNILEDAEQILWVYRDIIKRYYKDDTRMEELYRFRIMWELLYCVILNPAHIHNPKSYKERKKDFEVILKTDPYVDIFSMVSEKKLSTLHRIVANRIRHHDLFTIIVMCRLERIYNRIRYR